MTPAILSVACPGCRKPVLWQGNPHRPFCSERCRILDLGVWADESYRIAGPVVLTDDDGTIVESPKPD